MSRLHLEFGCGRLKLAGTLDTAPGTTGLLIVSGGNEIRSGAFSDQAQLAANIAKAGFPVFRFDRRGIGDSQGENRGFKSSAGDIRSAVEAFGAIAPQLDSIVAFGNCDAASALMLSGGTGFKSLVLSNPWVIEEDDSPENLPRDAIRARYADKLKNPAEIARLLRGEVDLRRLMRGLRNAITPKQTSGSLAGQMESGLMRFGGNAKILLAGDDRTAQIFESKWNASDPRILRCEGADHSYITVDAREWLTQQILSTLRA
ncbi:MAG: hydrolase 1, exosortase A system-associated [Erythrobacter sp.]